VLPSGCRSAAHQTASSLRSGVVEWLQVGKPGRHRQGPVLLQARHCDAFQHKGAGRQPTLVVPRHFLVPSNLLHLLADAAVARAAEATAQSIKEGR
jgi:hypothetical protein